MATFNVFGNQIEVKADIIKYLEHMHWLENEKNQLMSKVESMIKNKTGVDEIFGIYTRWGFKDIGERIVERLVGYGLYDITWQTFCADRDGMLELAEATKAELEFEISAVQTRDAKSAAAYNSIVSNEFSRVKGLDFGIITSSFVSYMIYNSMNEKKLQKSQSQAYDNIDRRTEHLEQSYQKQMLSKIDQYYIDTYIPALFRATEKTFAYITNKYLELLCQCNQLDIEVINKLDVAKAQSILENNLKHVKDEEGKKALFVTCINYCPFNVNVYRYIVQNELLDADIIELMNYVGIADVITNEIRASVDKKNPVNSVGAIGQLALIEKKDRKEILASYFKDEYDEIIKKYANFAKIANERNNESFIKKLSTLEYVDEIKCQVSKVVTEERIQWLTENCGFDGLLAEIANLVNYTGELTYGNVIGAYVSPITEYAKDLFTKWEAEEEKRRIEEEKRKAEKERKRKELEEKRNKINAQISEQEQIVADNKHKLFGQGAKMKKDALARIEELKQELNNLR